MKNLRQLREQRDAVAKRLRDLLDKHPGAAWGAEQQKTYDADLGELDRVEAEIKRIQAVMDRDAEERFTDAARQVEADRARVGAAPIDANALIAAWRNPRVTGDQAIVVRDVHAQWLRGAIVDAAVGAAIRNTMSTGTGSEGGYTVPTLVTSDIVDALKGFSGMREVSDVMRTATGAALSYPTSDGTSEVGELIGENTTATGADLTFGTVALTAYKYSSKIIAVPFELLQDTVIDLEGLIRRRIAQRIGRITNTHFTTGSGTGQPRGVMTSITAGKTGTTGQTLTVIFDDLVDLIHSVNYAYRQSRSCRFMMRDTSLAVVRKLKDSQGRPIFLPGWDGLGKAIPDTLLGYPVQINDDVAAMAANAYSIAFGDFNAYKIRDVMDVTLFRFTDSAYAKLGQVGFLAWMRAGGNRTDDAAIKAYRNSAS